MSLWKNYLLPQSLTDALQALTGIHVTVRLIAGGTDLLLDLQQGRQEPVDTLIDITRIPELTCLELRADGLFIGAGVPLDEIIASPLIRQHAFAVYEACGLIGGLKLEILQHSAGMSLMLYLQEMDRLRCWHLARR